MNLLDFIPESVCIAVAVVAAVIVAFISATVLIAALKKVPLELALKLIGLAAGLGLVVGVGAVITYLMLIGRKGKPNASGSVTYTFPADSGAAAIRRAVDETRDRIRTRIEALLQQGGGG